MLKQGKKLKELEVKHIKKVKPIAQVTSGATSDRPEKPVTKNSACIPSDGGR